MKIDYEGTIHEFPDDFTDSDIQSALAQDSTLQTAQIISTQENRPGSALTRFGRGLAQTTIAPAAQLMSYPLSTLGKAVGSDYLETLPDTTAQFSKDMRTSADKGAPDGFDWASVGGQIAGTLPAGALKLGQAVKYAPLVNRVLQGGVMGGQLTPTTENDAATDVGVGAGISAVLPPVVRAAANVVGPKLSPAVQALRNSGVGLTIGQNLGGAAKRLEDAARSIPLIGDAITYAQKKSFKDMNRAAMNESLKSLNEKLPAGLEGREAVEYVSKKLGAKYDNLLPQLHVQADPQFIKEIQKIQAIGQSLPKELQSDFQHLMQTEVLSKFTQYGRMSGATFKDMESRLGNIASTLSRNENPYQRDVGQAAKELQRVMRGVLERSNPDKQGELSAINEAYAKFLRVQEAAGRVTSEGGVFTPEALTSATRTLDPSKRKSGFARGNAVMQEFAENAKSVMGNRVPDSGTATRGAVSALAALGLGGLNPTALMTTGALSVPYLPAGRSAVDTLLFKRPAGAKALAEALRNQSGRIGTAASPLALQISQALMNGGPQGP